jgi:hypothetical protein
MIKIGRYLDVKINQYQSNVSKYQYILSLQQVEPPLSPDGTEEMLQQR